MSSPLLKLRELSHKDVEYLLAIEQSAHISPWSRGMFESAFTNRSVNLVTINWGLYESDTLVGYFIAEFIAGEMTLHNICVATEQQGKGLASKLMKELLLQAKALNTEDLWLEVRASNSAAIHLYKKFGFEQKGIRKNYYTASKKDSTNNQKEDALLMCLSFVK